MEYILNTQEDKRERLLKVMTCIEQCAPLANLSMDYNMPTFRTEQGWISVANQKHYLSVYTCQAEHIAAYKMLYPKQKTGKGCINFSDKDAIDFAALTDVINNALSE